MSSDSTSEKVFQDNIIEQMVNNGWVLGKGSDYHREYALYPQDALAFVKAQEKEWEKFQKVYPNDTDRHFIEALVAQLKKPTSTRRIKLRAPLARLACCVMG